MTPTGDRPSITILAGPNGAGKSTVAPRLLRDTLGLTQFVNADVIASGLAAYDPYSAAVEAAQVMLSRLRELASAGQDFAFETTLASRSYAPWLRSLRGQGWHVHLVFLWLPSADLAVERVKARVQAGGHDVPEETIRRRYARGLANFHHLYLPIVSSWAVYDNSSAFTLATVAQGEAGAVAEVLDAERWERFCGMSR